MEVIITANPSEVAKHAADIVCKSIKQKPNTVLGLATGSTPLGLYNELIQRYNDKKVSFSEVITYNLDEYVGISPQSPQSYRYFMNKNLFEHIDILLTNTHLPNGNAENLLQAGLLYEQQILENGGINIQILGIGSNGHIGFNEPTSSLGSITRIKTLTEQTIKANSRFFAPNEFQPHLAITMGIKTIQNAHHVVLLATGKNKANAIAATIEGPLTAMCPASALQMHPHATLILDIDAASELKMTEYYKRVSFCQQELIHKYE